MPRGFRLLLITVCSLLMVQSVLAEQDPATPDAMCYPVLRMDKVIPGPDCQMLVRIWFENAVPIGGFDLLLQYDPAAVSFTGAQAAGLVAGWEYFTYRWEENKIRLVGIADITNGTHPDPSVYVPEGHIIDLCFNPFRDPQSPSNCFELNWVWEDCGDNTMASPTGDTLYVVYDIEKILPDAGCLDYHGFGPVIPLIRVINGYFCFESDCPREGDCNNDRNIDGSDVAYLIDYLLRNGVEPVPGCECDSFCRADFNCDGKLNLTDISTLIRYVYYQPFALPCGIVR
jgi:hypothetical protein